MAARLPGRARVAELADAEDSKSSDREVLRVQVPPRARVDRMPCQASALRPSPTLAGLMARPVIERRLMEIGERLRGLRADLAVADEQLAHFTDEADNARVRALVSETALADREHRGADRHARAMERHCADVAAEIARLESNQDDLLDRLTAGGRDG